MSHFKRILRLPGISRDLNEELAFHFDSVVAELVAQGYSREAAEAEARRRFGDEQRYRRELSGIDRGFASVQRWRNRWDALREACKYALRSLRRTPGLSAGIILAFALGIGANATVYQVVDRLLLRAPAQLRDAATLRQVAVNFQSLQFGREINNAIHSYPGLLDFRAARSVAGVAGFNYAPHHLTLTSAAGTQRVRGLSVTGNFFGLVGVRPALGRLLTESDDHEAAARVVVLSYGFWQRQYGGSRAVLGQTVDFGQGPHTIVGVLPRGFTGVTLSAVDLWFPLAPYRFAMQGAGWSSARGNHWLNIVLRLPADVPDARAEAELTALYRSGYSNQIASGRNPPDSRVVLASLIPGKSPLAPPEVKVMRWLVAVSLVVLLIACINIANLLLARAVRERRALGIRLALGVTRARVIGQTMLEVTLFALLGGAVALLLARYGSAVLQRAVLPDLAWEAFTSTRSVLWVTLGLALLAGISAALVPALEMMRPLVLASLRSGAGTDSGQHTARMRAGLVITQVALSVALLAGAALFLRSFRNAIRSDLGINLERAWFLTIDVDEFPGDLNAYYDRALAALRTVPGVEAVAASSTMPFYQRHGSTLRADGWDSIPDRVLVHTLRGRYFQALGLQLLSGRLLTDDDRAGSELVTVVNRTMASTLYPAGALNKCLYPGKETRCTRIVGVVEDALLDGFGGTAGAQFYLPAMQQPSAPQLWGFPLRARADAAPNQVIDAARAALMEFDPGIRWVETTSFTDLVGTQLRPWRLGATLFTLFGVLALLVAVLGLYAVLAFDVSQRTRELGLRAALGGTPRNLLGLVLRRSVGLAAGGALAGVLIALLFAPRLQALLFRVPARDALSLVLISLVLLAAAGIAAWLPARRAARIDPLVALRSEL